MELRVEKRIFDLLGRLERRKLSRSIGKVDTTTDPPTNIVWIAGERHDDLPKLASYTYADGDRVYIVRSGGDLCVLGKVG